MTSLTKGDTVNLPDSIADAITAYVRHGCRLPGFLEAVFANDLFGAIKNCDDATAALLPQLVRHINSNLPLGCHGSYVAVLSWKGLKNEVNNAQ